MFYLLPVIIPQDFDFQFVTGWLAENMRERVPTFSITLHVV